jgi:hypothetical protein
MNDLEPCFAGGFDKISSCSYRFGTSSAGLLMPWVRVGISSWKILRFVSNSYPCIPSVPAADYLQCTSCSGFCCDSSGRDGKPLFLWSRHELWSSGIGLAFACIGNGSAEPGRSVAEGRVPRDSGTALTYGSREPDVGSTSYSWRTAEAGLPCVGAHGLTLASTSVENSRSGPPAQGSVLQRDKKS